MPTYADVTISNRKWGYRRYELTGADTLTYTGKNVTRVNTTWFFTTNTRSIGTYTYDNDVLRESTTFGGTITYQYDYNAANLPTVRRSTANGVLKETVLVEYETY
ncbi:MAG: hypothetical protein LH609_18565 [Rudanella sp.]|nr:hypothetical protein [Rudanella sp.]